MIYIFLLLIALIVVNYSMAITMSFQINRSTNTPIKTTLNEVFAKNEVYTSFYFISLFFIVSVLLYIMSLRVIVKYSGIYTLGGIFIFFSTAILLSAFFVEGPLRFVDSHPILFMTGVIYLILGMIGALSNTLKMEHVYIR
jgi:hypothetical protein